MKHVFGMAVSDDPQALFQVADFALGTVRSFEAFWHFAGVDLVSGVAQSFALEGRFEASYEEAMSIAAMGDARTARPTTAYSSLPTAWPPSIVISHRSKPLRYLGLSDRDYIARQLMLTGEFEPETIKIATALLADTPPGSVLDIGANIGTFALPIASDFPKCRIFCFEAQRLVSYQLCGAVAMNGLSNVRVHHVAVSDCEGVLDIVVPDYGVENNVGAFSLDPGVDQLRGARTRGAPETVAAVRLDDMSLDDVRLVKIDVEGMELRVLRGAVSMLRRNDFPPIICECWSNDWFAERKQELLAWLAALGYRCEEIGDNVLARHATHPLPVDGRRLL